MKLHLLQRLRAEMGGLSPHRANSARVVQPRYSYEPGTGLALQAQIRQEFRKLVGMAPTDGQGPGDPQPAIVRETHAVPGGTATEFFLSPYAENTIYGVLLEPEGTSPVPCVVCLQGHSSGITTSLGNMLERQLTDREKGWIEAGNNYGEQAFARGYAVLCLEQRGFGCRADARPSGIRYGGNCHNPAMGALLVGKTVIGQRITDVMQAIDVLSELSESIDMDRIVLMGNSGGGTIAYYTAALDERVKVAVASCCVANLGGSILQIDHCVCNYIPNMLSQFEFADLAVAIAPRHLIIAAGEKDDIFPISAVRKTHATIKGIYDDIQLSQKCQLLVGPGGHKFNPELVWPAVAQALSD